MFYLMMQSTHFIYGNSIKFTHFYATRMEIFYLMMHSHYIYSNLIKFIIVYITKKKRNQNVLFNDTLNTFF